MLRRTLWLAALSASVFPTALASQIPSGAGRSKLVASEDARLAAFFEETNLQRMRLSPETLTFRGMKERYDELGDYTEADEKRLLALAEAQVTRMKREFDRTKLSNSSRLSYDLFDWLVASYRGLTRWHWQIYAVSSNGTALDRIPVMMINRHRVDTLADAEAYVARLRAVERVANEVAADIDQRTARGLLPPALVFGRVIPDAQKQIQGAPFDPGAEHPVWADLKKKVAALQADPAEKTRILAGGEAALKGEWRRGYSRYISALQAMSSSTTATRGVWALPDGEAYYADMLRFQTTTDLTPKEIHAIGLAEVSRIRTGLDEIKVKVGFQGSLEDFFAYVKSDPKFRYPSTEQGKAQCLADARKILADYTTVASKQFSKLPNLPLEVRAVEPFRERTAPAVPAYEPGAADGSRPGAVYFNLSDLSQVLKPLVAVGAYHEGAPGHHFQVSRAMQETSLPTFRRNLNLTGYTEGWALYAEKLPKEVDFYQDPYDEFGRLAFELWRAARLVVDTGIHARRWSRDEAVAYMRGNTLNSDRDLQSEVDRYFTTPGQATAYKIGELKISQLRAKAQRALGQRFDVRDFHEAVLANGALPLDMLETEVAAYISRLHSQG